MDTPLTYPDAATWMWDYCVYLGPYKNPHTGRLYDLGVYVHPDGELSAAIVFGNEPGDYLSGGESLGSQRPEYIEAFKRAHAIGL